MRTRRVFVGAIIIGALGSACGSGSSDRRLTLVNPCPTAYDVAIFDQPKGGRERARFRAKPGLSPIAAVRADEATKNWAVELLVTGGSVRFTFEDWFEDGIVIIPALSCRPEELGG